MDAPNKAIATIRKGVIAKLFKGNLIFKDELYKTDVITINRKLDLLYLIESVGYDIICQSLPSDEMKFAESIKNKNLTEIRNNLLEQKKNLNK